MLSLAAPTDPRWAERAAAHLDVVLLDHAHCEKKAASTAINLIFRYAARASLVTRLSALAREELEHFEQVVALLEARGLAFGPLEPAPYAARLHAAVRRAEPERLLDTLLCCALIEARSCERMKLLADAVADPELRGFYRSLLASEARHHHLYVEMAGELFDRDAVRGRLSELAAREAAALAGPPGGERMHD